MRVGRGPLDEEAIRLLEAGNPDLEFDWTRILKGQGADDSARRRDPKPTPERGRRPAAGGGRPRREAPEPARPAPVPAPPAVEPPPVDEPTTAAHARLGSEGVLRLRARYSEIRARIADRVEDPDRQQRLNALAERLNPDGWVTDGEVSSGVDAYEATLASIRAELGGRAAGPVKPPEQEPAE